MSKRFWLPFMALTIKTDKKGLYGEGKCPECGETIVCRKKKDFESFSKVEYSEHFEAKHP